MQTTPLPNDQAGTAAILQLGELLDFFDRDWLDSKEADSPIGRGWAKRANAKLERAKAIHARCIAK